MWAFGCGLVSAGFFAPDVFLERWPIVLIGVALAGPLVCGTSQAVNDWFDRHVDAINEPNRPIPSGRVPGAWGLYIAIIWSAISLAVATLLGTWGFAAAVVGLALAWAYSAPPFRFKRNGWVGNAAVAACYEGLPWFTAAAIVFVDFPGWPITLLAALYSFGAHGIMTLNDFKSIGGDRRMGVDSLPVLLGAGRAAQVACWFMGAPQVVVIGLLLSWSAPWHAGIVAVSLILQLACMRKLLRDPKAFAPWYNATGVTLYVLGMLVCAFAVQSGLASGVGAG
jgi:chlorophyll synthase